jgi:hypothetical protein
MEQQLVTDSWLLVSTEGFRMQQTGREPALLVKELLQNSLDAAPATIDFRIEITTVSRTCGWCVMTWEKASRISIKCAAFLD